MLVVIAILGILGAALVTNVQGGYKQARQANCKSNLRQFGVAITIYRGEHDNTPPDWISNLYPEYVDNRAMYICRADVNKGRDTLRPPEYVRRIQDSNTLDASKFRDNESNGDNTRTKAIESCSYFYEFSIANPGWSPESHWPEGDYSTMKAYKHAQMDYGDVNNPKHIILPHSAARIPIIRCYHHWRDMSLYGVAYAQRSSWTQSKQPITLNVAYAGNVFAGPPWWEGTIYPGEARR